MKCILVFMQSNRYSCQVLMKLEFSRKSFEKYENLSMGSRFVPCGGTNGQREGRT
jgi:hypothetical protein